MESWVAPPLLLIAALAWLGPASAVAREATPGAARAARIEPVPLPRPRPASAPVLPRPRPGTEPAAPDPARDAGQSTAYALRALALALGE